MNFALFTCPGFYKVNGTVLVFLIARAQGLPDPCDGDLCSCAGDFYAAQRGIVGRDGERGFVGIYRRHAEGIAFHIHQRCFDPAGVISADGLDVKPTGVIETPDDLEVAPLNQAVFVEIGRAGTVATVCPR